MAGTNPGWLSPDRWFQALQLESSPSGWARYIERLRTLAEDPEERQNLNGDDMSRGWAIGTAAWRRELAREHQHRYLEQDLPHDETRELKEARWEIVFEQALRFRGLAPDAPDVSSSDSGWKTGVALLLRKHAGGPYRWITRRLALGSPLSVRVAVCGWPSHSQPLGYRARAKIVPWGGLAPSRFRRPGKPEHP